MNKKEIMSRKLAQVRKIMEAKYTEEERESIRMMAKRESKKIKAKSFACESERKLKGGRK